MEKIRRHSKSMRKEMMWAYLLIAPLCIGLLLFLVYPLVTGILYSFTDYNLFDMNIVWFKNYQAVFKDEYFWKGMINVLIFSINVPLNIALSLIISSVLVSKLKGTPIFRTIFFLPIVCGAVASTFIWRWMYAPIYGLIDSFLFYSFGIVAPRWLGVDHFMGSMIVMTLWGSLGINILLYSATLRNIPKTYYEAAKIDGANSFQRFTKITFPQISPITFYLLLTNIVGSMQEFSKFRVMSNGSFTLNNVLPVWYIYNHTGQYGYQFGYASALGVVYGLILLAVAVAGFTLQRFWVSYD